MKDYKDNQIANYINKSIIAQDLTVIQ